MPLMQSEDMHDEHSAEAMEIVTAMIDKFAGGENYEVGHTLFLHLTLRDRSTELKTSLRPPLAA